jgi:hypothetical protein
LYFSTLIFWIVKFSSFVYTVPPTATHLRYTTSSLLIFQKKLHTTATPNFSISPPPAMADEAKRPCAGGDCSNDAGTLQCPTCLKLGMKDSFFCSQECFGRNWVRLSTDSGTYRLRGTLY